MLQRLTPRGLFVGPRKVRRSKERLEASNGLLFKSPFLHLKMNPSRVLRMSEGLALQFPLS